MTGAAARSARAASRRRPSRVPKPVRPVVPVTSAVAVVVAWELVAHNSGAGWVQVLGDVLCGTLALGLIAPAVSCARARLRVTAAARDGTAGLPLDLAVVASTRLRVEPLDPPGPQQLVGPATTSSASASANAGDFDPLTLIPVRRGVYRTVTLSVSTASPFGFLWWRRRVVVTIPADLHVGPRLGTPVAIPGRAEDTEGDSRQRAPAHVGESRGVRPYRPGDNRRAVHWPATAHSGELMVREMEGPTAEPVTVMVRLPADADAAEAVAERAMGTVVALLDSGQAVVLVTDEETGPRTGSVEDRLAGARRLARATGGPGATPPPLGTEDGVAVTAAATGRGNGPGPS